MTDEIKYNSDEIKDFLSKVKSMDQDIPLSGRIHMATEDLLEKGYDLKSALSIRDWFTYWLIHAERIELCEYSPLEGISNPLSEEIDGWMYKDALKELETLSGKPWDEEYDEPGWRRMCPPFECYADGKGGMHIQTWN